MAEPSPSPGSAIPPEELRLLAGVEPRMLRLLWTLGIAGTVLFALWRGLAWGAGFAAGAAVSALSFHWMKAAIHALADSVFSAASAEGRPAAPPRPRRVVARFVLRYALIGAAGYVIFRSSAVSLAAFFAGLFVVIAAALAEAGYQAYLSFRSK